MAENDELIVAREDHVMTLTINRPGRRNALSGAVVTGLKEALGEADADPDIRVVCLTGAGDRVFCAGADLAEALAGAGMEEATRDFGEVLVLMDRLATPLVARVNGTCLGGGLGLMLACDLAVAADDATFGTPETRIGIFPMVIAPMIFRHAGHRRTWEMILTGRRVTAAEAVSWGLINRAVPRAELDHATAELLKAVCSGSPSGIAIGRRAVARTAHLTLDKAAPILAGELMRVLETADAAEGIAAFLQKRQPDWQGK